MTSRFGLVRVLAAGLVFFAMLWMCGDRSVQAQTQSPPGTIRVQVVLIPVNVRVTDKNGKPVLNLKKDDFILREDGVLQEIKHFSLQTFSALKPLPENKLPPNRIPAVVNLEPQTGRTFLVLLGRGKIQTPLKGIDAVIQFVRDELLPQDQVAVMAYNRATRFTTHHGLIVDLLERYKKSNGLIEEELHVRESGLAAIYGDKSIPKAIQSQIDAIFQGPEELGAREIPPGQVMNSGRVSTNFQQTLDIKQREEIRKALGEKAISPLEEVEANAVSDLRLDDFVRASDTTTQDLQNIFTAIEYLRYMPGEKHLLLVTPRGLFLPGYIGDPRDVNENDMARVANDARVSIDAVQTGGIHMEDLFGPPPPPRPNIAGGGLTTPPTKPPVEPTAYTFAVMGLQSLAQLTGGQAFYYQNLPKAFSSINETTRSEYLLGYYPKDTHWDGRYRRITVSVNRPGLHVYNRGGYYADQTLVPYNREAFLSYSRIAAAGQYASEVKDLHFTVAANEEVGSRIRVNPRYDDNAAVNTRIHVSLWIDPAEVTFHEVNDRYQGKVYITFFYGDQRGRYLGDYWDAREMNLKPETYQKVMKDGIPYDLRIPRAAPNETLKVVLYDYGSDRIGSLTTKVK